MSDAREIGLAAGSAISGGAGLLASMSSGDVAGWVERIGFPAAIVLLAALGLYRFARWFGAKVIEPVVSRHVAFVATMDATQVRQTAALERIAESEVRSELHAAKTLECVTRIEEATADDRKTHRMALEAVLRKLEDHKAA